MIRSRCGIYFGLIFGCHLVLQVLAWALADSPGGSKLFWRILSFPVFYILMSWATVYFWMVGVINSLVWGLIAAAFAYGSNWRKETA